MKISASRLVLAAALSAWAMTAASANPASPLSSQHATVQMPLAAFTCAQAAAQLNMAGYTSVKPTDCDGLQYAFEVERGDGRFVIVFNAESGGSVATPR
jgi:hypothetical protein